MDTQHEDGARRRNAPPNFTSIQSANGSTTTAKKVDDAPSIDTTGQARGSNSQRLTMSNAIGAASEMLHTTPAWFNFGIMVVLIFGGCCSNVSATQEGNSGPLVDG